MDSINATTKDKRNAKQATGRDALTAALNTLLTSPEARARIGSLHKGSESNVEAILPTGDLDKYC